MKTWMTLLSFLSVATVFAGPNDCDDYIQRHYRQDVVLTKLKFQNKSLMGDIPFRHQKVSFYLKNRGEVDFNASSSDHGVWRDIYMKINNIKRKALMRIPLDSGQSTIVYANFPPQTLKNCAKAKVEIDVHHTARQWGCQVWNNDKKTIMTYQIGRFCRIIRPFP